MKELDRKEIERIIESGDEKLVDELIELIKHSNASINDRKRKYTFGTSRRQNRGFRGVVGVILIFLGVPRVVADNQYPFT